MDDQVWWNVTHWWRQNPTYERRRLRGIVALAGITIIELIGILVRELGEKQLDRLIAEERRRRRKELSDA